MKYIITDKDEAMVGVGFHQDMGDKCDGRVISAGHCKALADGTYVVWGRSIGYNIEAKPEDAEKLRQLLTR